MLPASPPPSLLEALPPNACAACVGRAFARWGTAASNAQRGRRLRPDAPEPSDACPLCEGITARFDRYAALCQEAAEGYEFDSFLVGSILFEEIRRREAALYERMADAMPDQRRTLDPDAAPAPAFALAEFLKAEVNREVGKRLEQRLGRRVDFQRPALTFHVDTRLDHVGLQVASLFLKGRYRKLDRSLPQTRWPCRLCGGLGCRRCEYQGRLYEASVEEWVAEPYVEASGAPGEAFHGMGREDIDARMLGAGRPFVLELKAPRRRRLELADLASRVRELSNGAVEALDMALADPSTPAQYKAAEPSKTYQAACLAEVPIDGGKLISALSSFRGVLLEQRTPERVAHRRADLVRRRRIHEVRLLSHTGTRFEVEIRADSGTYIKEFVSGDAGRTRPSLSDALGVPLRVDALDVIDIDWKE